MLQNIQAELVQKAKTENKTVLATAYNARARYFNEKGKLHYSLESSQVVEYSGDYGTLFDTPNVKVLNDDVSLAWLGRADKVFLSDNKKKLTLTENVVITYWHNKNAPMRITGSDVCYSELKNTITSNKPVRITDGGIEHMSKELVLNIKSNQLNARKQVKAVYRAATMP